ncbi:hypothetical protein [Pseudomonas veronii]|uniref:hypothetical protein n=1 Tax=Pseudomonas veronii TaxID=76761 RepID=UPI003B96EE81
MEVALGWRDAGADVEVVALTVGPEDSSKTLRKMLAMGADSAVQITDDALVGSDAVQTARVTAAAVEKEPRTGPAMTNHAAKSPPASSSRPRCALSPSMSAAPANTIERAS